MSICRFSSFRETPILFYTLRVVDGLPLLADEAVPEILRKAWLHSALSGGWLVGAYCILPDRVTMFASAAYAVAAEDDWLGAWQDATTRQINEATNGSGRIWESNPPGLLVGSEEDYAGLRAVMCTDASGMSLDGAPAFGARVGMIWQLLPFGEPAATRGPPLGIRCERGET
jgi:hypothetical protein